MKKLWALAPAVVLLTTAAVLMAPRVFHASTPPRTLLLSGNIEAHESDVSYQDVAARVIDLPVQEGQWVKAGAVLARLDDSRYRQQVAVDEAGLELQQTMLEAAQPKLAAAAATVERDQAAAALRKTDLDRYRVLNANHVVPAQVRDQADSAYKQAQSALLRDRALVRAAQRDVEVAQAAINSARQTLRMDRLMLGYTVLHAPFSGVVAVRESELGEVIAPGSPVVTMADLDRVWLRAYVSESNLGRVKWGQAATVTVDSYPRVKFHGRVSFISPEAEFTPKTVQTHEERVALVYRIKIDLDNPQHVLKPGMPADARIDLTSTASAPAARIARRADGSPPVR